MKALAACSRALTTLFQSEATCILLVSGTYLADAVNYSTSYNVVGLQRCN